jgi:hypothetical protein
MFHSQLGWVSFGLHKTVEQAEMTAFNVKRFGNGFYKSVEIIETSRIKYIWEIIKMNIDNRF